MLHAFFRMIVVSYCKRGGTKANENCKNNKISFHSPWLNKLKKKYNGEEFGEAIRREIWEVVMRYKEIFGLDVATYKRKRHLAEPTFLPKNVLSTKRRIRKLITKWEYNSDFRKC